MLWAEGEVRQAAVFGENLLLRRRIDAYAGCDDIVIADEVRNDGFDPAPHRTGHPLRPLPDAGGRLHRGGPPPRPGPRPDGTAEVALVNDRLELGVSVAWGTDTLPHLVQWSHLRAGGYAVGLEPSTHHPLAPAGDPADLLAPGESRHYRVRLRVAAGPATLAALTDRITAPAPAGHAPAGHPVDAAG